MIIPIFIYREKKSDKELKEEMERERKWKELIEEDDRYRKEQERKIKRQKQEKKEEAIRKLEEEYYKTVRENPWDFQFLPEGWTIFGQTYIPIITEYDFIVEYD